MNFSILEWDSNFFGFIVARIDEYILNIADLNTILHDLSEKGTRLVYWPAATTNDLPVGEIKKLGGILADIKTTFKIRLDKAKMPVKFFPSLAIQCDPAVHYANIESLSAQCGQYSRFAMDPNIPRKKFIELYRLWVEKSISREIADEVLVIQQDKHIHALITLKINKISGFGEIGLLVVDRNFRSRKLGELILFSAFQWFKKNGCLNVTVDTQMANERACYFYTKHGFIIKKTVNFYHFWI